MQIKFKKELYDLEAIKVAVQDYQNAGIGNFEIEEDEDYIIVLYDSVEKIKKLREEFCNYVLAKMKQII